ncbi:MAG: methionine adenosyltransferase [Angelakisella sp.]|jgi:S-adenosylmethionine synthetase|nr:methionine adenosyltransferase [Angelakisella sp.]
MRNYYFTSESVTEGHPDKICDQISDGILDAILEKDPMGRVACETSCTTGLVQVIGEVTTSCYVDVQKLVREIVLDIGYDNAAYGFDGATCGVLTSIHEQSPDIALGVDNSAEVKAGEAEDQNGAGDQGMMFGYACNETPELMPMTIAFAHRLARQLTKVRKEGTLPYLRPDGKTQVTVRYEDGQPKEITTIVVSTQHGEEVSQEQIHEDIKKQVIDPVIPAELRKNCQYLINPTGRFVVGGPHGDSGLTGRKIIVDTYGGWGSHGGGAFSGKDPTKVDRSAAYAARWVAKNLVAAGLCSRCLIQLAYAIGVARPVSVCVDTYGTGTVSDEILEKAVEKVFDLRPSALIRTLDLRRPIYRKLAAYGHMGRTDLDVAWEKTDRTEALKQAAAELTR